MNQQNNAYGSAQMGQINYAPTMMDVFEFNADDLAANRNGTATERQLARVKTVSSKGQFQVLIMLGVMVLIIGAVLVFTPTGASLRQVYAENPTVVTAGLGGSLLLYALIMAFYFIRSRSAGNGKVSSVTGQFKLVGRPVRSLDQTIYQRVKIGKRNFYLTDVQASTFTVGTNYRVYFAGGGQMAQIVSVEQA